MSQSIEKWKFPVSIQIAIGFTAAIIFGTWIGSGYYYGVKEDSASNTLMIMKKLDSIQNAINFDRSQQKNFNDNQSAYNSDMTDFRRRAEVKFGWR